MCNVAVIRGPRMHLTHRLTHTQDSEEWEGDSVAFSGGVAATSPFSKTVIKHETQNQHAQGKQIRSPNASARDAAQLCTRMEQ